MRPAGAGRRAIGWLAATLALVAGADLLLATTLPPPSDDAPPRDALAIEARLERATADVAPWLLLGDSVLAGDVMEGRVDGWRTQRVVDHLRAERRRTRPERFYQVALDGMLPVDMERVLAALDRADPAAHVRVMVELNPRYFSEHYADDGDCTRAFLCTLPVVGLDALLGAVRRRTPIARHRDRIETGRPMDRLTPPSGPVDPVDPLAGRARLGAHYAAWRTDPGSAQWAALRRIVEAARQRGRRVMFFATPVEDGFLASATSDRAYGALLADLSRLIDHETYAETSLVQLDAPTTFPAPLFLDHVHLGAEGNRRLALNLLHEANVGLERVPDHTEIVYPEGPDHTLVGNPALAPIDGPRWLAGLRRAEGIAISPGARRIVVADTHNQALRDLTGAQQTLRTLAGQPGQRGTKDGPASEALLDRPRAPVFLGDSLYFQTNRGARLRRLQDGVVSTVEPPRPIGWRRIGGLRAHDGSLWILDDGRRILRWDPTTDAANVAAERDTRAFDVAPDGRLFIVDRQNRVWLHPADGSAARVVFANTAETLLPEGLQYFPFRFDEVRLQQVQDIRYVARYDGLLVQDILDAQNPNRRRHHEAAHLRFLSLRDKRVYPWVKPRAYGNSVMIRNEKKDAWVSPFHRGAMALDPATATVFYVERSRSRLYRVGDGLLGAAKTSHTLGRKTLWKTPERFGPRTGRVTQDTFRPQRHLGATLERLPRQGPYSMLALGSSYTALSDLVGAYSMYRLLEHRLGDALGYRDGIRLHVWQRTRVGGQLRHYVKILEGFAERSGAPDVILLELQDAAGTFLRGNESDAEIVQMLTRIRAAAERHGALVVIFDDSGSISRGQEGLWPPARLIRRVVGLAEQMGFPVVAPLHGLFVDHLRVMPWGSPPYDINHMSPWAIEATAARLADLLHPHVAAHLRGRTPAWRGTPDRTPRAAGEPLSSALDGLEDVALRRLPRVGPDDPQVDLDRDTLSVLIDVADHPDAPHRALAAGTLHALVSGEPAYAAARSVQVRVARFDSYDEYGLGVLEGAKTVWTDTLDRDGLHALWKALTAR